MKRGILVGLVLGALLTGCDNAAVETYDPASSFDPKLTILLPEEKGLGTVPYRPSGELSIELQAEIPALCKPIRADVELITPSQPEGAKVRDVVTLTPQEPCEKLAGTVKLAWPEAGEVEVRATLAGTSRVQRIVFDAPELDLFVDREKGQLEGLGFHYPFCVEASAVEGTRFQLQIKGATLKEGDAASLPLKPGRCGNGLLSSERTRRTTYYEGELVANAAEFEVGAVLIGAPRVQAEPERVTLQHPGVLELDVQPGVAALPDAGEVLDVVVHATLGGTRASRIPVRIETVPETAVLPASGTTDINGTLRTSIVVPKDALGLRIDAIAGDVRRGITLHRAP